MAGEDAAYAINSGQYIFWSSNADEFSLPATEETDGAHEINKK